MPNSRLVTEEKEEEKEKINQSKNLHITSGYVLPTAGKSFLPS
jgi:hypothetical protein